MTKKRHLFFSFLVGCAWFFTNPNSVYADPLETNAATLKENNVKTAVVEKVDNTDYKKIENIESIGNIVLIPTKDIKTYNEEVKTFYVPVEEVKPVEPPAPPQEPAQPTISERDMKIQNLLAFVRKQLGKPYVWGAIGPRTYDCSGLVQTAYKTIGVEVPRTTYYQVNSGTKVTNKKEAQPGDLLFFSTTRFADHVGIYIGDGQMIHAPQTGDVVKISNVRLGGVSEVRRILP